MWREMLGKTTTQVLDWLLSWPGVAIVAVAVLLVGLRVLRRVLRAALRLVILLGILAVIVGGLFVLRGLLSGSGLLVP